MDQQSGSHLIRIQHGGKTRQYSTNGLRLLAESKPILIQGRDKYINKAVTVAELIKRKYTNELKQSTTIFNAKVESKDLDSSIYDGRCLDRSVNCACIEILLIP
jgi:DNA-binding protein